MTIARYRTVLVVEDDDDVLSLTADLLRERGFMVYTARSGEHALARLGAVDIDVILLDLSLPGMSGSEFLAIHRSVPTLSRIPVVILSGSEDAWELGAQRNLTVLHKPFGARELLSVFESRPEPIH